MGTLGGLAESISGSVNELTSGDFAGRLADLGGRAGGNCRVATLAAIRGVNSLGEVRRISLGESCLITALSATLHLGEQ
jgi:hypothetical protein